MFAIFAAATASSKPFSLAIRPNHANFCCGWEQNSYRDKFMPLPKQGHCCFRANVAAWEGV